MRNVIIEKRICLHSKYLDQNIMKYLFSKLEELTNSSCSYEHGHILKIEKIIEIVDHEIGRADTDNIFTVKFEAQILKPEKGIEMTGKVCMIYKDGIFINVMNKQKILIPRSKLSEYIFLEIDNIYQHNNNKKIIKLNDILTAVVIVAGYTNQSYSCFGSIV
jgi:DNA-directed RNA polymerase subunit E'/Rpb7